MIMPEQTTMEAWMKAIAPGKEHEMLAKHEGQWEVTLKSWMTPGEPPIESHGTARLTMVLNGHAMAEAFRGKMMDMDYEGYGMLGYDSYRKEWWQTWTDNVGTGIMVSRGKSGTDPKILTLTGKMDDAMQNRKDVEVRNVYHFTSDKQHSMEMYTKMPDGKEMKTMEIEYRRK
jgi:hypothetical protein